MERAAPFPERSANHNNKGKGQVPEQRDDLALDAETVKDLEPKDSAEQVRGGGYSRTNCGCNTTTP